MSGFTNKPRILRGAFVEYGLSLPLMVVAFQFNPEQVSRSRQLYIDMPGTKAVTESSQNGDGQRKERHVNLRDAHEPYDDLIKLRDDQQVSVQEETITLELRLDATDALNEGDAIAEQFGVLPQLATLELMVLPKSESLIGQALGILGDGGVNPTRKINPPLILFIWGRKRVLPVNINSLTINETMFSPDLNPLRATVSVSLTVIEGKNFAYKYSKAMLEAMSALNISASPDITNVVIPG